LDEHKSIDLNADVGEGMPYDAELMKIISSCNIACGGHCGDYQSISNALTFAKSNGVKIGAHPSYPDQENFGRKSIEISTSELIDSIDAQLKLFQQCVDDNNVSWTHIKFHGALYNDLKSDLKIAEVLVQYLRKEYPTLILFVPPNSVIKQTASGHLKIRTEGFADRAYNKELGLVPRNLKGAVLVKKADILRQVLGMINDNQVKTLSGKIIRMSVDTICLHGDTPNALSMAKEIHLKLEANNISIK